MVSVLLYRIQFLHSVELVGAPNQEWNNQEPCVQKEWEKQTVAPLISKLEQRLSIPSGVLKSQDVATLWQTCQQEASLFSEYGHCCSLFDDKVKTVPSIVQRCGSRLWKAAFPLIRTIVNFCYCISPAKLDVGRSSVDWFVAWIINRLCNCVLFLLRSRNDIQREFAWDGRFK